MYYRSSCDRAIRAFESAGRVLGCAALLLACGAVASSAGRTSAARPPALALRAETLPNGLKVVVAPDRDSREVAVAVYYRVGFRDEHAGRSGLAHLFEHLMMRSSSADGGVPFSAAIRALGGSSNASTRPDYTGFVDVAPASTLDDLLTAEALRMKSVAISAATIDGERRVVMNEIRAYVLNAPYGGFPWLIVPRHAFATYPNAHNGFGEQADLDAVTTAEAARFGSTYYAPSNAVVVVAGDVDAARAMRLVERRFGGISAGARPPIPDVTEPDAPGGRTVTVVDSRAPLPAVALAYRAPAFGTKAYVALVVLKQLLTGTRDSILPARLANHDGYTSRVESSLNQLGSPFGVRSPSLYTIWLYHDRSANHATVVSAIDEELARLGESPVSERILARAKTLALSDFYDQIEPLQTRVDLLASLTLLSGRASGVNDVAAQIGEVTPDDVRALAAAFLRPEQHTAIFIDAPAGTR